MPRSAARTESVRISLPLTTYLAPALVLFCTVPLATAGGWWALAYLVPAAITALLAYARTTATRTGLTARWLRGRTRIEWEDLRQIEFPTQRWAVAVTRSGTRVLLPAVRPPDLPRLVAAAGAKLFLVRPGSGQGDDAIGAPTTDGTGDAGPDVAQAEASAS